MKIALITNELAPYRTPVFSRLAATPGIELHIFTCIEREPNRFWTYPPMNCGTTILKERMYTFRRRYIHSNFDVVSGLARFGPDVVVTDGFNPTHLYAFCYAQRHNLPHVAMTDGTDMSEKTLTFMHRVVRRFVFSRSQAFVSASHGGMRLHLGYGVPKEKCFTSCLCVDNESFARGAQAAAKTHDFMFCGRFEAVKNPLFALKVAVATAKRLGRKTSILFVGSGSLEDKTKAAAAACAEWVDATFFGFAAQDQLPALYGSARLFLFPSSWDPWGVVANEACASGLPVIVSPFAGAADELIQDGRNGFICELNVETWAIKAESLLCDAEEYRRQSEASRRIVRGYSFDKAAAGLAAACQYALSGRPGEIPAAVAAPRPKVLIVERQLLNYRMAFYNCLRGMLERDGIELQLLVGEGTPAEKRKKNEVSLGWSIHIPTHYLPGTSLCWQPFGRYAKDADLVIVMHENKILYNLWLMLAARPKRLAFWGHGANLQSDNPDGFKERFKRWTVKKVDWWFAYTDSSAALVAKAGFPAQRTTVVQNAVDTEEMIRLCGEVSAAQCRLKRREWGLGDGPVGLYLGSLYKEKRLDFLLAAAALIRSSLPDFQLLVVGAGPEQHTIEQAAAAHPWIHYLGPLQGNRKAEALVLADVLMNPGLVGLGILDSFASGTPMFTTDCGLHSPEISYLAPGHNGVMTNDDVHDYAAAIVATLRDARYLESLGQAALASASQYTVENMAARIRSGILACLDAPRFGKHRKFTEKGLA
ncbi:MAG TPA: glycosyltransferase family 4 protein [Burkholderiaceae bacterium]